jgi:hypothetical protein
MATANNPFQDFLSGSGNWYKLLLSEMPMEQYYSSPTGQSFYQSDITDPYSRSNPRKQRYFDQSYQNIYQDYMGETGRALREGTAPATFMQFMQNDPWTKKYTALPQSARGRTGSAYNPRTRFLYNF